jgi:lipid-A-disaccharide synthase
MGEVSRLGADFIAAAAWIAARQPGVRFLAPMASTRVRDAFAQLLAANSHAPAIDVLTGQAQQALAAANGVVVASGTATLETLLSSRPMVVAYRLGALTAFLLKQFGLVKVPYFSQPNLLLGRARVPEFFQDDVTGQALGEALLNEMADRAQVAQLQNEFRSVHEVLRRGGAARAADAILEYVGVKPVAPSPTSAPRGGAAGGADGASPDAGGTSPGAIERGTPHDAGGTRAGAIDRGTRAATESPRDTPRT